MSLASTLTPSAQDFGDIRPMGPLAGHEGVVAGQEVQAFDGLENGVDGSSIAPSSEEFRAGIFTTPGRTNGMTRTNSA